MSAIPAQQAAVTTWNIDAVHSVAEFKVKHMMISNVKGKFTGVHGVLVMDETDCTNHAHGSRGNGCGRRSYDSWRRPQHYIYSRRTNPCGQRSLGKYSYRSF